MEILQLLSIVHHYRLSINLYDAGIEVLFKASIYIICAVSVG